MAQYSEAGVDVRLSYARLRRAPMHRWASGKILAAYLDPSDRDAGAAAVAAPILDRRGRIAAGLSVAGPTQRIVAESAASKPAVRAAARAIERACQS